MLITINQTLMLLARFCARAGPSLLLRPTFAFGRKGGRLARHASSADGASISLEDVRLAVESEASLSLKPSEVRARDAAVSASSRDYFQYPAPRARDTALDARRPADDPSSLALAPRAPPDRV